MDRPALTREESREVDRHAIEDLGYPGIVLMENAGRGCVDVIDELGVTGPVLIVCGRGNNAGDGFVIARHLTLRGTECRVVLASNPAGLSGDALTAYQMMQPCDVPTLAFYDRPADAPVDELKAQLDNFAQDCELLVDALLGTGAKGNPRAPYDAVIRWLNRQPALRLAIDVPSGLDCDSGAAGEPTFRADHTCTFVAPKAGFLADGAQELLGQLHVVGIGLPTDHSCTTDFGVRRTVRHRHFDGLGSPSYGETTTLRSKIALTVRQRPLLAPLLAATACVDLVLLATNDRRSDFDQWAFWGVMIPQLGLLAIWLAMSLRHWVLKLVIAGGYSSLLSVTLIRNMGPGEFAEIQTLLAVYFTAIFSSALLLRLLVGHLGWKAKPLQYSTWQLIVLMTVAAILAAFARQAAWPIGSRELPIFVCMIVVPVVTLIAFWLFSSIWVAWTVSLLVAGIIEFWFFSGRNGPDIFGFYTGPAVVCGLWFTAIQVEPDARRRLAARRLRRQPKLAVVAPPADAPTPERPTTPSTFDTTT